MNVGEREMGDINSVPSTQQECQRGNAIVTSHVLLRGRSFKFVGYADSSVVKRDLPLVWRCRVLEYPPRMLSLLEGQASGSFVMSLEGQVSG